MSKKPYRILVMCSDYTGVEYFRSSTPHINLEKYYPEDFHVDIVHNLESDTDEFFKQYNIIHYHRTLIQDYSKMPELINRLKALNIVTCMDLDDYWAPGSHHPAFHIIKKHELDKKILNNIKTAEYITTTTPIFAEEIAKYNKNVFVMPNAVDPAEKQFLIKPIPSNRIRIGYLAGSSHLRDLEGLRGMVAKLRTDGLLDKITFVLCGFDLRGAVTIIDEKTGTQTQRPITPKESAWYQYEQIFTDNYTSISEDYKKYLLSFTKDPYPEELLVNEAYRRVWTKPIQTYATNYNLFDISLAPLEENIFNKVKSSLKLIEGGFYHKACIAQNFGSYTMDTINLFEKGGTTNPNGNCILIDTKNNHSDWYKAIKKLVQNPELITQLGENLYNTVKDKYSMEAVCKDRRNLYLDLLAKNGQ